MIQRLLFILLTVLSLSPLRAQKEGGIELTTRTLVGDTSAVEAGKPFRVAIHFKIAEGWHTYWQFPGSPGFPINAQWELPVGWQAGEIEFPLPELLRDPSGSAFFAYEHDVAFLVKITPPAQLAPGDVKLVANLKWQVCKDICIAGRGTLELSLPTGTAQVAHAGEFGKWSALLPKTTPAPTSDVKFLTEGKRLIVRIGGLPADAKVEFFPQFQGDFSSTLEVTKPIVHDAAGDVRTLRFPFDDELPADLKWSGLLVVQKPGGPREGWMIGAAKPLPKTLAEPVAEPKPVETVKAVDSGWDPFDDIARGENGERAASLFVLLVQGFLGGLLLNLMPCVLPVISLKIFGFLQQAGEAKERVFKLGLAFCAGVFAFFGILAVLVVALASTGKSLGWGAQFSNPLLLTAMLGIVFLFGLSLLGVFEITLGGAESKLSELSAKEGPGGAFLHGLFTTLLGTSCTAPLVGPVIGAAIARPGPQVFALFAAIATGLSLPYFLLTWQPAWMKFLPKPGTWMVRFKQLLGFVMLALVVWLIGSLPSTDAIVMAASFLLVLGFGAWLVGTYHDARWAIPLAVILAGGGWAFFVQGKVNAPVEIGATTESTNGIQWEPFSIARIRSALEQGKPVFIDFTAKWCLNCKVFEKLAIHTEATAAALKAKGVVTIKADYTNEDPAIAAALKKANRAGVPLYVLFRKRGDYWLADGLTQSALLEQLGKL